MSAVFYGEKDIGEVKLKKRKLSTLDRFLAALKKTKRSWVLDDCGCLRFNSSSKYINEFCPITKVAQSLGCKSNNNTVENAEIVGKKVLGLLTPTAQRIIDAADEPGSGKLRDQLLTACGVEERLEPVCVG